MDMHNPNTEILNPRGKVVDYLFCGGGCAALSLVYAMQKDSFFSEKKIIIVDPVSKSSNDRTWSFWAKDGFPFSDIAIKSWKELSFKSTFFNKEFDLDEWSYFTIRGIDFYNETLSKIKLNSNVQIVNESVKKIIENSSNSEVIVTTENTEIKAKKVFDSRVSLKKINKSSAKFNFLLQHFKGWIIETAIDKFEPNKITLFDFKIEQKNEVRFIYILPFSKNKALVEFTVFGPEMYESKYYSEVLSKYIQTTLNLGENQYEIKEEEFGKIPMTDQPFKMSQSQNVLNIGAAAGLVKPSSGYAFTRIQRDTLKIVSLLKNENVIEDQFREGKKRFKLFDSMLLNIMVKDGASIERIFSDLFKNNPIDRVFRFLDEDTSLIDDFYIMNSVPPFPFINSLLELKLKWPFQ